MNRYVYLSPDGQYIIEVDKSNRNFYDIIGYCFENKNDRGDFIFDLCGCDFQMIFSAWEYLGEV